MTPIDKKQKGKGKEKKKKEEKKYGSFYSRRVWKRI